MGKKINTGCALADPKNAPVKHQLIELFWMLVPAYTRWAESQMNTFEGLTPQRMRLLGLLRNNGPMKMSALGDELGVTATNITALVDALEADHKVCRKPHPTDRRATMIELTAQGEKWIAENCTVLKDKISELFSDFPAARQEQFLSHLLTMREALVKRNILEASDICPKAHSPQRKIS